MPPFFGSRRALILPQLAIAIGGTGAGNTGSVAFSTAVTRSGNAFTFTAIRTGDTSGPWVGTFVTGGGAGGGGPATAADFSGAFPTGPLTFAAGQTSKTVTVTPSTNVEPE